MSRVDEWRFCINHKLERETKALKQLDTFLSLKRMAIVTNDEEETVPLENGKQIEVIPAWKWLLE